MAELTIGRLAREAGVNVETIRYYQRRRLLAQPDKPASGYRRYDAGAVRRVYFIRRAQALGFTLEEIGSLLSVNKAHACTATRALASHRLNLIERKLAELAVVQRTLKSLLRQCGTATGRCPIIGSLSAGTPN